MKKQFVVSALAIMLIAALPAMAAPVQTFDVNPTLSATQAPGVWYTDRYAPETFESAFFDGDNRLHQGIDDSDGANSRPGAYSSAFYNTQGRKFDVDTTYMCIDLWIPSEAYLAANVGTRFAGFWGTAIDASDVISAYPIVEYRKDVNGNWGFSVWDGIGAFIDLGAPTGFANEAWYSLEMVMVGDEVTFNVGDISYTVDYGGGTQSFTNAILQGYNTTDGVTYDIYWDNFKTEPVPEPGTMALLGMGIAGMAMRRFRKRA